MPDFIELEPEPEEQDEAKPTDHERRGKKRKRETTRPSSDTGDRQRLVPWRDWGEWREVKRQALSGNRSEERRALETIEMWESRGHCPAAVSATARLLEDHQTRGSGSKEDTARRMALSMTITRLVNGVTDLLQKGRTASSIGRLAEESQLPQILVDLRHSATHRSLPSIFVLELAKSECQDWLREHYWEAQDARLLGRRKEVLRTLRAISKEVKSTPEAPSTLPDLLKLTSPNAVTEVVVPVLLEHFLGRPPQASVKLTSKNIGGIFAKQLARWSSVLKKLGSHWPRFHITLADRIARRAQKATGWEQALLSCWCSHLIREKEFLQVPLETRNQLYRGLYKLCVTQSSPWLEKLLIAALEGGADRENHARLLRLRTVATERVLSADEGEKPSGEAQEGRLEELRRRLGFPGASGDAEPADEREPWTLK